MNAAVVFGLLCVRKKRKKRRAGAHGGRHSGPAGPGGAGGSYVFAGSSGHLPTGDSPPL
ncbi:hypothetical protein SSCG_00142 [Streptomyces clavuligerus]|nr:hypothetical protein SSCG_00142 [Streptomyces clavuligerus]